MIALFPGQGSQHVGMGRELHDNFKIARETFEEVADSVHANVKKLCFEGPESELTLTENTQPCLLTLSVAAFRVAQHELGFRPSVVAGHSLGEYSALVAADSLRLAVAARWVRERGAAMQRAVPAGEGGMAAILGLDDGEVEALCVAATELARRKRASLDTTITVEALVQPANFNAPGQVVIAGSSDAVAEALALAKTDARFSKAKGIPLDVSAPFHSRLMAPARDRMAELFALATGDEKPRPLTCPYVPNRTSRLTREPGLVFELLVEQVDHPVLWRQSFTTLLEAGHHTGVEFGPGKVLVGLAKRIGMAAGIKPVTQSCGDLATLKALEAFMKNSGA